VRGMWIKVLKMSNPTKAQINSAKQVIDDLLDEHEHSDSCMEIETVEVTYWPTPDIDQSYSREVYVCNLTGEQIDLEEADPELDREEL
jgi:hypothetical protein